MAPSRMIFSSLNLISGGRFRLTSSNGDAEDLSVLNNYTPSVEK
jgi:hypothetical protein